MTTAITGNSAHSNVFTTLLRIGNQNFTYRVYRYKGKIHQFAYRFVRCSETATELTQLVFVRLWKYKHTVDATKDFNAFLLTITRNLVYKEFQRKAKANAYENELANQEHIYDPVASFMDLQDYRNLAEKAMESLAPQSKKVFKLSREEGASYERISNELNISKIPSTVTWQNH
ncbi:sigma-70 family RNA polymerase sigma factor [Pedobacter sp. PLR]|uniref:sigma-70 family RNA polymerase sigma factor n=1 Tax=Pedobacter sp. PLR TaxID=2994465 RepID=UPI0022469F50|nr:sigma-70 family RNA polymerase sigma factor [Pedobacter sp. PLR]MCX2452190.1 sigma-70 family RNA polymerase sigma factor [Pedobacter sp. PLR]